MATVRPEPWFLLLFLCFRVFRHHSERSEESLLSFRAVGPQARSSRGNKLFATAHERYGLESKPVASGAPGYAVMRESSMGASLKTTRLRPEA